MIYRLSSLLACFLLSFSFSNAQWSLFEHAGNSFYDYGQAIETDMNGNVYSAGVFLTSATFGTGTLVNSGSTGRDMFLVKYDASGNVIWTETAAGLLTDVWLEDMKIDGQANIYVTGHFIGTAYFGSHILTSSQPIGSDLFVAKYDSSGTCLWAHKYGDTAPNLRGLTIAVDDAANVFVAGQFEDSLQVGSNVLVSRGDVDGFLIKLDPSGTVLWATSMGGVDFDRCTKIEADNSGNVYVLGWYRSGAFFDTIYESLIPGCANNTIFLAKYDAQGQVQWVESAGGTGTDDGYAMVLDGLGHVYIGGRLAPGEPMFQGDTLSNWTNPAFIARYTTSGNFDWVWTSNGVPQTLDGGAIFGLEIGSNGNLFAGGVAIGNPNWGPISINTQNYRDYIVSEFDTAGNPLYAATAGGMGDDFAFDLALMANGNYLITGSMYGDFTYDGNTVTGLGQSDICILEHAPLVSREEAQESRLFTLAPNPADGSSRIEIILTAPDDYVLEITDMSGKLLLQRSLNSNCKFKLPALAAGQYLVRLRSGSGFECRKLIIH